jgi:hypothetical protein
LTLIEGDRVVHLVPTRSGRNVASKEVSEVLPIFSQFFYFLRHLILTVLYPIPLNTFVQFSSNVGEVALE